MPRRRARNLARNVEIKARVGDLEELQRRVIALADGDAEVIAQEDVFFPHDQGRLKLRILAEDRGQLIFYRRSDHNGPKLSDYQVSLTREPQTLLALLRTAMGERGRVKKSRRLYMVGRTRVHLDQVEGLGDFLELEVVLRDEDTSEEGEVEARSLLAALGVSPDALVAEAYIDLLEAATAPPR